MDKPALKSSAIRTIELEYEAVENLTTRINDEFISACEIILQCQGRVIVMGIGKSGHIANKIAATLASTGTPAQFVHAAEASHGDIGMVTDRDVVIAISNSGTTPELETILPVLKRKGVPLIALTGNPASLLARQANANLDASVEQEACPLGLAPTTSTTAALVLGDALAMALLDARGFTAEDFALSHPGGNLGRRLLLKVSDIMHAGDAIPRVSEGTSVRESLLEISAKKLGMTTVTNQANEVSGVFTDGDLRRFLDEGRDIHNTPIKEVMTTTFKSITPNSLASEAAKIMQDNEVYTLLVMDDSSGFSGIVAMHDLLKANVV
ncbi:MAG: KpsF/GutQ family sugar-phosphate isomerase [Gammaproteobacteria bacterium]|nr:KpsF/GutQ family sugar-phosphate isomerase [Gammaproteobacteria bacterium]